MPTELLRAQIVFEDEPLLRLCFPDGTCVDFVLRRSQVLLLAKQALAALCEAEGQGQ
jgi:hypothetical protein